MSASASEDFWPTDIADEVAVKTPLLILREQAAKLNEKTRKVVEAEVLAEPYGQSLEGRFILKAPALGGYEYVLLRIRQPAALYPVKLEYSQKDEDFDREVQPKTETEFEDVLKEIFQSPRTINIIKSLLAQSKSA